ncbi:MAG: sulfatase [Armatimonadota bacterium]|nr:sulfatase [Armatimonadota bacterium]
MKPKHVILCLLDAASARHMSCYGYHRKTTPNIDALAEEGVIFRKCFSPANYTICGCGSIHTGRYAENHGVWFLEKRLEDDDLTFAETMRRAGYTTAGWASNLYASSHMGYNIGFEHFDDFTNGAHGHTPARDDMYGQEQEYHARFGKWLEETSERRTFAYIHFMPPHEEYEAPEKFRFKWAKPYPGAPNTKAQTLMNWEQGKAPYTQQDIDYVRDLYDEYFLYADYNVGLVIEKLKELGMWDDTLFILLSDHGEAFMEHGFTLHNTTMYDEMIHVPLVIKLPKGMEPKRKDIDALVELIDIYPTVADMLGIELPEGTVDGKSLLPLMQGTADKIKDYSFSRSAHSVTPILSVRTLKHKYIYNQMTGKSELYDLEKDPLEKTDVILDNKKIAANLHTLLKPALEYYRKERGE